MKKQFIAPFSFFLSFILLISCSPEPPLVPQYALPMTIPNSILPHPGGAVAKPENLSCLKGIVIRKVAGVTNDASTAVSVLEGDINRGIKWGGKDNVFEILSVPKEFSEPGTIFYFSVRLVSGLEVPSVTFKYDGQDLRLLFGLEFSKEICTKK